MMIVYYLIIIAFFFFMIILPHEVVVSADKLNNNNKNKNKKPINNAINKKKKRDSKPDPEPSTVVIHGVQDSVYANFIGDCQYLFLPVIQSSYYLLNRDIEKKTEKEKEKEKESRSQELNSGSFVNEFTLADYVKRREPILASTFPSTSTSQSSNGATSASTSTPAVDDTLFYVLPIKPHPQELEEYLSLPDSFTWVNDKLAMGIVKGEPMAERWASRDEISWTVPIEHPRSNKTQCLRYTRLANQHPIPLYSNNPFYHSYHSHPELQLQQSQADSSSSSSSSTRQKLVMIPSTMQDLIATKQELRNELNDFYLLYKQHAIIHETGIVASKCGYFQSFETCEMKFRFLGKKWFQSCQRQLQEMSIDWNDFVQASSTKELWNHLILQHQERLKKQEQQHEKEKENKENESVTLPFTFDELNEVCLTKAISKTLSFLTPTSPNAPYFMHYKATSKSNTPGTVDGGIERTGSGGGGMPLYDKVIVISSSWDNNYHHFFMDLIARIIRVLPFLQANPDIKIHTRYFEQNYRYKNNNYEQAKALRSKLMHLLGLDPNRLVFGFVKAKEVYIPRSMYCNQVQTNALEIRLLAKHLLHMASIATSPHALSLPVSIDQDGSVMLPQKRAVQRVTAHANIDNEEVLHDGAREEGEDLEEQEALPSPFKIHQVAKDPIGDKQLDYPQTIVLQQRYCAHESNCTTKNWRSWTNERHEKLIQILIKHFPRSRIMSINDRNASEINCLACEIQGYREADVLIGYHGAGLTNAMFMKPGSIMVEITGQFDGRMLPKCGYHGPLATVFGIHHYIYYYDWRGEEVLDFDDVAYRTSLFYKYVTG